MLLVTAVALMFADLATTLVGIRLAGPGAEDNPVWHRWIARHGLPAFVLGYVAVMGAIVYLASLGGPPALAGLVAVLALTVLNNLYVLGKLLLRW